jgi:hypothetical protein
VLERHNLSGHRETDLVHVLGPRHTVSVAAAIVIAARMQRQSREKERISEWDCEQSAAERARWRPEEGKNVRDEK